MNNKKQTKYLLSNFGIISSGLERIWALLHKTDGFSFKSFFNKLEQI